MKITKDDLATLLTDPEYQTLATSLTLEQHENTSWWNTLDLMMTTSANATVWETTQLIALLFDTYPDQIKSMEVAFENDHHDGHTNMLIGIRINGNHCDRDNVDLSEEENEACKRIDGAETLTWALEMLDNQACDILNPMVDKMNSTIKRVFTGSAQALEVGRQVAPEIQNWVNAKRLGALAEQTRSKTLLNVEQVAGIEMAGVPAPKI